MDTEGSKHKRERIKGVMITDTRDIDSHKESAPTHFFKRFKDQNEISLRYQDQDFA
jgi:hypothetical protein